MSRIYKKSNLTHSESLSGIAFGGGGGGGGGGGSSIGERDYANAMKQAGWGYTRQLPSDNGGSAPTVDKKIACATGAVLSTAATNAPNPLVKGAGYVGTAITAYLCS